MKITVLNGSPKGDLSVTLRSVAYLAKTVPCSKSRLCRALATPEGPPVIEMSSGPRKPVSPGVLV